MSRNYKRTDTQGRTHRQEVTNRDVNATQRAMLAVQLRTQKLTYEQIALQAGYANAGTCRKAIMREMQRVAVENVDTLRREELAILDKMHSEIWSLFINPANKGRLFAADRIIAISERRSKLMGLDVRPDEQLTAQNYTKRVILTHQTGGQDAASN